MSARTARLMRRLPPLEAVNPSDLSELGDRVAFGLWGENTGLPWTQRLAAIVQRKPAGLTWAIHYGPDGMASSMTWPAWDGQGLW